MIRAVAAFRRFGGLVVAAALATLPWGPSEAQPQPPLTPRELAPFDLTGYWVSLVTEEWVQRMTTPPVGDYRFVPLNAAGRVQAESWNPGSDEASGQACRGYAAPAIMRMPSRLQVSWEDEVTLRIDIDTGTQTRMLHFEASDPGEPSWQGHSAARWELAEPGGGASEDLPGALQVDTTNLRPGYLQKNGVPFSDATFMTEYYNLLVTDDGTEYLVVQIFVDDPVYLSDHWVGTVHFRREPDGEGFRPTSCSAY